MLDFLKYGFRTGQAGDTWGSVQEPITFIQVAEGRRLQTPLWMNIVFLDEVR
jgi:hypothetical protein